MNEIRTDLKFTSNSKLGKNKWWLFLCSTILVIAFFLLGSIISGFLGIYLNDGIKPDSFSEYFHSYPNVFISQIGTYLGFISGMIGLIIAVRYIHRRKFLTLITVKNNLKFNNVIKGAVVYFILEIIVVVIYSYVNDNPLNYQLNINEFLPVFFVSIFFVSIQICSEEFFHRGFLFQNFTFYFKYPFIALLLTSFFFAYAHVQDLEYLPLFFLIGLFLGLITIVSNSLELAIGIHFAHNIFSLIITDDNLDKSIFYHKENPENIFVWLTPIVIFFILSIIVFGSDKFKILFQKESKI